MDGVIPCNNKLLHLVALYCDSFARTIELVRSLAHETFFSTVQDFYVPFYSALFHIIVMHRIEVLSDTAMIIFTF